MSEVPFKTSNAYGMSEVPFFKKRRLMAPKTGGNTFFSPKN